MHGPECVQQQEQQQRHTFVGDTLTDQTKPNHWDDISVSGLMLKQMVHLTNNEMTTAIAATTTLNLLAPAPLVVCCWPLCQLKQSTLFGL